VSDRSNPIPPLDLSRYTEATRRTLYDRISAEHFAPLPLPPIETEDFIETRTAEQAGLTVLYLLGRWFAVWRMADPPEAPLERDLWEIVSVSATSDGLSMAEV
jgi:hypothetical protein